MTLNKPVINEKRPTWQISSLFHEIRIAFLLLFWRNFRQIFLRIFWWIFLQVFLQIFWRIFWCFLGGFLAGFFGGFFDRFFGGFFGEFFWRISWQIFWQIFWRIFLNDGAICPTFDQAKKKTSSFGGSDGVNKLNIHITNCSRITKPFRNHL